MIDITATHWGNWLQVPSNAAAKVEMKLDTKPIHI
jgi:hypothetical protein